MTYAKRAMEEAESGEAAVSRLADQPRGTLRVAMPVTLAQSSVASRLAAFSKTIPSSGWTSPLKGGQLDPIAQRVDVVLPSDSTRNRFAAHPEANAGRATRHLRKPAVFSRCSSTSRAAGLGSALLSYPYSFPRGSHLEALQRRQSTGNSPARKGVGRSYRAIRSPE